jgi:hypothetical protein
MKLKIFVSVILLFLFCFPGFAQEWTKVDSIWLQNVLEGKEAIKINEDTRKAIEEGRLITPPAWFKNIELEAELIKDFDNIGAPDSFRIRSLDPYSMPPAVYALYVLYIEKMDSTYQIQSLIISAAERMILKQLTPGGGHDFNHALSMLFSKHYRQLVYNRKHANAYKNYYDDGGAIKPIRFTDRERQQLIRSSNTYRPPIKISSGSRFGGIDN